MIVYKTDMMNSLSDYFDYRFFTSDQIASLYEKVCEIVYEPCRMIHCIDDLTEEEFNALLDFVIRQDF